MPPCSQHRSLGVELSCRSFSPPVVIRPPPRHSDSIPARSHSCSKKLSSILGGPTPDKVSLFQHVLVRVVCRYCPPCACASQFIFREMQSTTGQPSVRRTSRLRACGVTFGANSQSRQRVGGKQQRLREVQHRAQRHQRRQWLIVRYSSCSETSAAATAQSPLASSAL
jgi:hypothetical protein